MIFDSATRIPERRMWLRGKPSNRYRKLIEKMKRKKRSRRGMEKLKHLSINPLRAAVPPCRENLALRGMLSEANFEMKRH